MKLEKEFNTKKMMQVTRDKLSNEFNNMRTEDQKKHLREHIKPQKASSPF